MRRLRTEQDLEELASRIRRLAPESPRQWGKMSCRQMICHLSDAFRGPLGQRPPAPARGNVVTRTIVKWLAMRTPLTWPRGAATTPDIDQAAGRGTRPAQFDDDVAVLIDLMRRFIAQSNGERRPHPLFGPMNASDWARWGWGHVDHHLRQFGG